MKNEWIDLEEESSDHHSAQAFGKIANYFKFMVLKQDSFQAKVNEWRKSFDIVPVEDEYEFDYIATLPKNSMNLELENQIREICPKYGLTEAFVPVILNYLYHDEVKFPFGTKLGLCVVEKGEKNFPALIKISPYSSETDIIDFVQRVFKNQIAPLQNSAQDEDCLIGKVRKRSDVVAERDEQVVSARRKGIPVNKIVSEIVKTPMSEGEARKIISKEEKERKQM
jgi:hypothetical protein